MTVTTARKPLGQLLVAKGVLQPQQLERALEEQRRGNHQKLLGEIVVEMRLCTEDQVVACLAQAYGVPFARINPRLADPKVIGLLPRPFLEKHQVIPLFLVEAILTVAVPEPANVFLIEEIERVSGRTVQVVATMAADILSTLQAFLASNSTSVANNNTSSYAVEHTPEQTPSDAFTIIQTPLVDSRELERAAGDLPATKLVNHIIYQAIKQRASDIRVEPFDNLLRVRYRIDGQLIEKLRPAYALHGAVAGRIKIMAGLDVAQQRTPQEGDVQILVEKRPVTLRISVIPGKWGETIGIRIVDNDRASANLEKLGFEYETLKAWRRLIAQPNGLILVTGPAGSGKSTTLYAALGEINKDDINVCTIEDPIEYSLPGINQFQVNEKAGFGFSQALTAVLRQEPDILMVGEVRDGQTGRLATQAALAGHLVFTSLNNADAPGAITRLINLGVDAYLVGSTLTGVLSQRLIRKLCQQCKEPYSATANELRHFEKLAGGPDTLFRPRGCPACHNSGYSGRIGVFELLVIDDAVAERITQGVSIGDLRELAKTSGMKTIRIDGMEKVKAGITTLEEVYRAAA
jgi:type IV pilus assembly protein PilB